MKEGHVAPIASFAILLALAWFVYGRIFELQPFGDGNLHILFWADRAPASELVHGNTGLYPEWRPLAYLTVWLQYRWFQIDHVFVYHAVNLFLWTGCAWLVWEIVRRLTGSFAPGLLAAAVVLTDTRTIMMLTTIEHYNSLACFFGLFALLIVARTRDQRLTRPGWIALSLALLASALSKEFGLAFAGAVAVSSLLERRRDAATAAIAAGVMYALIRIAFAGGAVATYCEQVGYFFTLRDVCYDGVRSAPVAQAAYNVAATAIGTILPGLFTDEGQIGIASRSLAMSVVWLAVVALGCSKSPTTRRMTFLVVAFSAALSFMLYRDRNHMVALCALGVALGVGLAVADAAVQTSTRPRRIRATAVAALLVLLAAQALATRELISDEVVYSHRYDPCDTLRGLQPPDPAFITRIKTAYGMPNPDCAPGR